MNVNTKNIINAIMHGYKLAWGNPTLIARIIIPATAVYFACFAISIYFESAFGENSGIRLSLILLPSFFFQGAAVCLLARFSLMGMVGLALNKQSLRFVLSGIVIYALLSLSTGLIPSQEQLQSQITNSNTESAFIFGLAGIAALIAGFWAIRIWWLFVPASIGYPLSDYIKRMKGFESSASLLIIWLACSLPIMSFGLLVVIVLDSALPSSLNVVNYAVLIVTQLTASCVTSMAGARWIGRVLYQVSKGKN